MNLKILCNQYFKTFSKKKERKGTFDFFDTPVPILGFSEATWPVSNMNKE